MANDAERAPRERLSGLTVAISISLTPDLRELGFLDNEDERVLAAILTALVYGDARVAYGGRIESPMGKNFTLEISGQLAEAYRRSEADRATRPMIHYLRASDARREGPDKFFQHVLRLGAYSEIKLLLREKTVATLLPQGGIVDVHIGDDAPVAVRSADALVKIAAIDGMLHAASDDDLAGMRAAMTQETHARIVLGGRVGGSADGRSGVAMEVLSALEAEKPLLIVGGIGGVARDAAAALGLIGEDDLVERAPDAYRAKDGAASLDNYKAQMAAIRSKSESFQAAARKRDLLGLLKRIARSESHDELGALVPEILSRWCC
jgi:hypothetical protein